MWNNEAMKIQQYAVMLDSRLRSVEKLFSPLAREESREYEICTQFFNFLALDLGLQKITR